MMDFIRNMFSKKQKEKQKKHIKKQISQRQVAKTPPNETQSLSDIDDDLIPSVAQSVVDVINVVTPNYSAPEPSSSDNDYSPPPATSSYSESVSDFGSSQSYDSGSTSYDSGSSFDSGGSCDCGGCGGD